MIDLKASVTRGERLRAYNAWNKEMPVAVKGVGQEPNAFQLPPEVRVMIPTGQTVEAPAKIYIKQDVALKKGLELVTSIQRVDETQEVVLLIKNTSDSLVTISNGETLAQAHSKP